MPDAAPATRRVALDGPLDLRLTLGPLRRGRGDRATVLDPGEAWRATRTPEGPATVRMVVGRGGLVATAWGPGAAWALDHVGAASGADDGREGWEELLARPGGGPGRELLRGLHRRLAGLRMPATAAVCEALVPSILEQKVTGLQARGSFAHLLRRLGEPAPGPGGLRLPPAPGVLAATPSWDWHRAGVEGRRAATVVRACRVAPRLEALAGDAGALRAALRTLPGVGAWTVAEVARVVVGDADAVSVGDYHLHDQVAWALAGLPRGGDDVMLELLEPYRGHRARVTRLIEAAGIIAPRFGPRLAPQRIEAF